FGGKFQFFGSFAGDLVKFHAEPTRAVSVQKNTYLVIVIVVSQSGGRFELLDGPAILGKGHFRRQICAQFRELADFFLTPLKFCLGLRRGPACRAFPGDGPCSPWSWEARNRSCR